MQQVKEGDKMKPKEQKELPLPSPPLSLIEEVHTLADRFETRCASFELDIEMDSCDPSPVFPPMATFNLGSSWHDGIQAHFPECFLNRDDQKIILQSIRIVHVTNPMPLPICIGLQGIRMNVSNILKHQQQQPFVCLPACSSGPCEQTIYNNPLSPLILRWFGLFTNLDALFMPSSSMLEIDNRKVKASNGENTILLQTTQPVYWYGIMGMGKEWRSNHLCNWQRFTPFGNNNNGNRNDYRKNSRKHRKKLQEYEMKDNKIDYIEKEMNQIPKKRRNIEYAWDNAGKAPIFSVPKSDIVCITNTIEKKLIPLLETCKLQDLVWTFTGDPRTYEQLGLLLSQQQQQQQQQKGGQGEQKQILHLSITICCNIIDLRGL